MHLVQSMAYTGAEPWHGLGTRLESDQPIEVWRHSAGMDWDIEESEVRYVIGDNGIGTINAFPSQKVLYRSDTKAPLAVVSKRFQVVQPSEILEFYRDLTELGGFKLETAGVLREGRKFWALAKTGQSTKVKNHDRVDGYLLLATACDGTLATTAQFTSVRVVCNNTLAIALGESSNAIKISHRSQFDPDAVKRKLGITVSSWDGFVSRIKMLAEYPVDPDSVEGLLQRIFTYPVPGSHNEAINIRALKAAQALYNGDGKGALMRASHNTAWGVLNSVTEYVDHHRRARSDDHRRDAAWFGSGAQIKQKAWDEVTKLIA